MGIFVVAPHQLHHATGTRHRRRVRCTRSTFWLLYVSIQQLLQKQCPKRESNTKIVITAYLDLRFPSKSGDYDCNGDDFRQPADHLQRRSKSSRTRPGPEPRASSLCGSCPRSLVPLPWSTSCSRWQPQHFSSSPGPDHDTAAATVRGALRRDHLVP
jgi:hypothetical protein